MTRRGLSELLSVLLLLVIIAGSMAFMLSLTKDLATEYQITMRSVTKKQIEYILERFVIEHYYVRENILKIYVRNIGEVDLVIDKIVVNKKEFPISATVSVGEGKWISCYLNFPIGGMLVIHVITKRGNEYVVYWK